MSSSGKRQDVAFLALAVAFLAVALALFVGLRSIQRDKPEEPEPEPVEIVEAVEPEMDEPPQDGGRDPFRAQSGSVAAATGAGSSADVRLVGIVMEQGDKPMAIIRSGRKRYYASLGERAAGYTVVSIGQDRAVLEAGGRQFTLVLREPEPEE
jgi:hypothetical protein